MELELYRLHLKFVGYKSYLKAQRMSSQNTTRHFARLHAYLHGAIEILVGYDGRKGVYQYEDDAEGIYRAQILTGECYWRKVKNIVIVLSMKLKIRHAEHIHMTQIIHQGASETSRTSK